MIVLFSFSESSLGHSLLALEAIDWVVSKDAESLCQDLLLKTQEMMKKEFSHIEEGCLPENEIQCLLLGANRIIDYALSMDMQLIKLKQHALRIISAAITGSACCKLLDILEAMYGYPETLENRQHGMSLARFSCYPSAQSQNSKKKPSKLLKRPDNPQN